MHLEFISNKDLPLSKKDVSGLIKRMLYKCKNGKKTEVFPGCFIEKKSFSKLAEELENQLKKIVILDIRGKLVRNIENDNLKNCVFVLGDSDGLPKKEMRKYKDRISLGGKIYFASHSLVIIHNEMDIRGL